MSVLRRRKCDDGYTLYSSRLTEAAHLVDPDGQEVHRWSYEQGQTWHYAEMLLNGHLVAIIKEAEGQFPGMILELDWRSRLVWKAHVAAHHDFERLDDGNTLVVCRDYVADDALRPGTLKSDAILELSPKGEIVWEWHAHEHVREIAALVPIEQPLRFRDWAHTNTVEALPHTRTARKDPRFQEGNLLFSCRNIDTIGVIDRPSGQVVWAWGPGQLDKQHMPTLLANGHLLVFDNGCSTQRSRIVEMDPLKAKIVWQYVADPPESFYSSSRGSCQRLPNGNTFIADSNSGRLFEVTPKGAVVWEFLNPDLLDNGRRMPIYRALRYPRKLAERLLAKHGGRKK